MNVEDITSLDQATEKSIDDRIKSSYEMADRGLEKEQQRIVAQEKTNPFLDQGASQGSAIAKKSASLYKKEFDRQKEMRELGVADDIFKSIEGAANLQSARAAFARQKEIAVKQRIMDARAQRAQTLATILGIGFTVGGAMVGGPVGPAAVAGVGQAAAQNTASGNSYVAGGHSYRGSQR